ncbi:MULTISPECIES: FadR/GntR family transcriptional regulator [unclassified Leucobacter]|uniref:FadR/GntR family transcriptional regulator n=1 Tax=unclassified Leucobacter TaxID=2621730 RepID=UPI00165DA99B|nr:MULTISPECIES: FCD domain-containing protein [unclassified Leucobacter]MBC9927083.1 FadR family transcriptional regulator [Leucobacter sp. cx-169]MBC9936364.1 FadR family transcriptional regulator [Leucobacter sp. cx-87]
MHPPTDRVELLIRAVRPTNAYEETMQRLLQSIRLGLIAPGERLPAERELASMLKVSRDTVRDALATLVEAHYVVSRRGRTGGTFVALELPVKSTLHPQREELGEADVEDNAVLRRVVEVGAAREAAGRELSAEDRAALAGALAACTESSDVDHRRLDSRLHLLIAELSGSPSLVPIVANARTRVNALLDEIPMLRPNLTHSDAQHAAIVTAILSGQPDAAAAAMLEHIEGSTALLRGFFAARGGASAP